ncbi:MAG: alcohol dehydrogenase catalytic domain-containing protein [Bacillota bacterium]|jgi:threonine dehydrogenase-like Zn-dependent dehydrogenase
MKAIAKTQPGKGASLINLPTPTPTDNEVLIKVECSAICGSDIHLYNWASSVNSTLQPNIVFPVLMGHEMAGTIVSVIRSAKTESDKGSLMKPIRIVANATYARRAINMCV